MFIGISIYIIYHRSHLKNNTQGHVLENSVCNTTIDSKGNSTTCSTKIIYTVNGQHYTITSSTGQTSYKQGDEISVYYDPNHPELGEINPISSWVGWLGLVLSGIIILLAWARLWLVRKSKVAAALTGEALLLTK